jgi:alpha/beta superfamily hydrolase
MADWSDMAAWHGQGLCREVFYFGPAGERLYGSLYSAEAPSRPLGIVVCPSWGVEADRTERLSHGMALAMARTGGAGLVFHYPGHGDSQGDLRRATMDTLVAAAGAAVHEAARRRPDVTWFFAGLMLGASVACRAQEATEPANRLLLVQPALRPSEYFERLARSVREVTLSDGRVESIAYGYPLPAGLREAGPEEDALVARALARFDGDGAVVRCAKPPPDPAVPAQFEEVVASASWRFGVKDYPDLDAAVTGWLDRRTAGERLAERA